MGIVFDPCIWMLFFSSLTAIALWKKVLGTLPCSCCCCRVGVCVLCLFLEAPMVGLLLWYFMVMLPVFVAVLVI